MYAFYLFSVWLHLLAAAVWIGGMVFLALVLIPVTRQPEHRSVAASLVHRTGMRFRLVGWACLGLLLLTGVFNVTYRGFGWSDVWSGRLWQGPFSRVLGIKLLLVAAILVLSALHDFVIGPQATALLRANPASQGALQFRRRASRIGRITLLLALIAVALGVILVRGGL